MFGTLSKIVGTAILVLFAGSVTGAVIGSGVGALANNFTAGIIVGGCLGFAAAIGGIVLAVKETHIQ